MPPEVVRNEPGLSLQGFEDAKAAYERMEPAANALTTAQLSALNVDVVGASSTILGVSGRILAFRERMAKLPEFDLCHVDELEDRARAAWYAAVTSLPEPEPGAFRQRIEECVALRSTLLVWAVPLVHAGVFEQKAIDRIKQGSGNKDLPGDVVALVALYRSRWEQIKGICGVTEAQLEHGATLAPAVFAAVSHQENKGPPSDGTLRVRRFWTLADRSYKQCRRALAYLRWEEEDTDSIAPNLRHNTGPRRVKKKPAGTPAGPVATSPAAGSEAEGDSKPRGTEEP